MQEVPMKKNTGRSRLLIIIGLIAMVAGAIDPLEGSIVILIGIGLVMLGSILVKSRHRKMLVLAFVLILIGVGAMFGLSSVGGFGGDTGRSWWWAITIFPTR